MIKIWKHSKMLFVKMKSLFKIFNNVFVLYCTIIVYYFIFYRYLAELSIIRIVQIFLLLWTILQVSSGIMQIFMQPKIKKNKELLQHKKIVDFFYVFSDKIISYIFYVYAFIFIIFGLYTKSFIFIYIMIAVHSLFLGYWLAIHVGYYLKRKTQ